jgi:hypothetical protein
MGPLRRRIGLLAWLAAAVLPLASQTQSRVTEILRLADAAFDDEDRALAEKLYRQVLALDPFQSRAVYRLGRLAANDEASLRWFLRYTELEPDDAWGWVAAGDKYLKVGKPIEAKGAFDRAAALAPKAEDVLARRSKGRIRAAPTVEPTVLRELDSDGDRTWGYGMRGEAAVRGGFRLGASAGHLDIGDGTDSAAADEFSIRLEGRPRLALRLDVSAGLVRLTPAGEDGSTILEGEVRLRWRKAGGGPAIDARVQRLPLLTSPLLVRNRAARSEGRFLADIPAGPIRFRIGGRIGSVATAVEEANRRLQADLAVAYPLGWRGEVSAQYHRLGFARASRSGYFAPRSVETMEGGTYWDFGGEGMVTAALDLGAGIQRLARQMEPFGPWRLSFRGWGLLSLDIGSKLQGRAEAEVYSAPFSPVGVPTSPDWRYFSIRVGIAYRIL